jgi:hypothetical protein
VDIKIQLKIFVPANLFKEKPLSVTPNHKLGNVKKFFIFQRAATDAPPPLHPLFTN